METLHPWNSEVENGIKSFLLLFNNTENINIYYLTLSMDMEYVKGFNGSPFHNFIRF